jgi:putative copper resistance protein D
LGLCSFALFLWVATSPIAQSADHGHPSSVEEHGHHHEPSSLPGSQWEGSREGVAYSEFNHHLAGVFLLLIGLSELRQALGWPVLAWTRFLLPGALGVASVFLLIWSDHDAWPIGSMTFAQTFLGTDPEVLQHKTYAVLAFTVGLIEFLRRLGWFAHAVWTVPLPIFAVVGGLMLFAHSHGEHPAAHKIALHHVMMGTMAITAGSSKLISGWRQRQLATERSYWELIWAILVLVIGVQLLFYSE